MHDVLEQIKPQLLGKTQEEAETIAKEHGFKSFRVEFEDGTPYVLTMDLHFYRINWSITKGLVTDASVG